MPRLGPCHASLRYIYLFFSQAYSPFPSLFISVHGRTYGDEDLSEPRFLLIAILTQWPLLLVFGTIRNFWNPSNLHGSNYLFIMFSLLQRGLGEESVVVLVCSCADVVRDVATVALFWRWYGVVVQLYAFSDYFLSVQYLFHVLIDGFVLYTRLVSFCGGTCAM